METNNKTEHRMYKRSEFEKGMKVAIPRRIPTEYFHRGYNFRYPSWEIGTIRRVTPKRTKIEIELSDDTYTLTIPNDLTPTRIYEPDDAMVREAEIARQYGHCKDYILELNRESLSKLKDEEIGRMFSLLTQIKEMLDTEQPEKQ